uniref:Uncharacterized protein n=1 Tax=Kalanchoe fedtschenkoi TaxID=63787 RepID=A0A7N0UTI4_KALFE
MEGNNLCDFVQLDEDVLPPPRKRLLAGYKKLNSIGQSHVSKSASPPPTELDTCVKNLLSSRSSGSSSRSFEEIAETSREAALAAAKVAEAARTAAEDKAAIAARAIAAAKSALELVAALSEEASAWGRDSKKNKSKKQVTAQLLHKKHDEVGNDKADEETARKLHQVIYSSSRLSNHSPPSSDSKRYKHKRTKISPVIGKPSFPMAKIH